MTAPRRTSGQAASTLCRRPHENGIPLHSSRIRSSPLTPKAETQARATGKLLGSEFKFNRVFTSPFKRTMDTAQLTPEEIKAVYRIDPFRVLATCGKR
jgi:broad specificity phosphatase PhoE